MGEEGNVSKHVLDKVGFGLLIGVLIAGRETLGKFYSASRNAALHGYRALVLWRHYGLPAYVRPWLARALSVTLATVVCTFIYVLVGDLTGNLDGNAWLGFAIYAALSLAMIVILMLREAALARGRSASQEEYDAALTNFEHEWEDAHERPAAGAWERDPDHPADWRVNPDLLPAPTREFGADNGEYHGQLMLEWSDTFVGYGRAHPPAPRARETEAQYDLRVQVAWERNIRHAVHDWQQAMNEAFQASFERDFGPGDQLGVGTFGLVFLAYGLQAVLLSALASWVYAYGAGWVWTLGFAIGSALMFFLTLLVVGLIYWLLGLSIVTVIAITVGIGKGLADSLGTAAPNVMGEEAKVLVQEAERRVMAWNSTFGQFFKQLLLDALVVAGVLFFTLSIIWPDPYHRLILAGLLLLFAGIGWLVQRRDPDAKGGSKLALWLLVVLAVFGAAFRVVEFLVRGAHGHLGVRETPCVVYRELGLDDFFYVLFNDFPVGALLITFALCALAIWAVRRYASDLSPKVRDYVRTWGLVLPVLVAAIVGIAFVGHAFAEYSDAPEGLAICQTQAIVTEATGYDRVAEVERQARVLPPAIAPAIPRPPIPPAVVVVPPVDPECCPPRASSPRIIVRDHVISSLPACVGATEAFRDLERRQGACL